MVDRNKAELFLPVPLSVAARGAAAAAVAAEQTLCYHAVNKGGSRRALSSQYQSEATVTATTISTRAERELC